MMLVQCHVNISMKKKNNKISVSRNSCFMLTYDWNLSQVNHKGKPYSIYKENIFQEKTVFLCLISIIFLVCLSGVLQTIEFHDIKPRKLPIEYICLSLVLSLNKYIICLKMVIDNKRSLNDESQEKIRSTQMLSFEFLYELFIE